MPIALLDSQRRRASSVTLPMLPASSAVLLLFYPLHSSYGNGLPRSHGSFVKMQPTSFLEGFLINCWNRSSSPTSFPDRDELARRRRPTCAGHSSLKSSTPRNFLTNLGSSLETLLPSSIVSMSFRNSLT